MVCTYNLSSIRVVVSKDKTAHRKTVHPLILLVVDISDMELKEFPYSSDIEFTMITLFPILSLLLEAGRISSIYNSLLRLPNELDTRNGRQAKWKIMICA